MAMAMEIYSSFRALEMDQPDETIDIVSSQLKAETKKKYKRGEITKLIASESTPVALVSSVVHERSSNCWSSFKRVPVRNVPQDFAICNTCKTLITYKTSTGTGGVQKHADSCTKRIVEKDQSTVDEFLIKNTSSSSGTE